MHRTRTFGFLWSFSCLVPAAAAQGERPATRPSDEPRLPRAERVDETIVTATRVDDKVFDVPFSAFVLDKDRVQNEELRRTTPEALSQTPQILGQKTSYGQGSPFLRGFTGYNTLFLIDGIRLNNSTFRPGPNQYWNTVDPFSYERLEVVMGAGSVLYGSDAVGGVVQSFSNRRSQYDPGVHADFRSFTRLASGEQSIIERLEGSGNVDDVFGAFLGVSLKDFGDIRSGDGELPYTGYDEWDMDVRLDFKLSREWSFTTVYQRVFQDDVPRTHTTIYSVPFEGTTVGTELLREHDQKRDLLYARFVRADADQSVNKEQFTLYVHNQEETRSRLRTGNRFDHSGFTVVSPGAQIQVNREAGFGTLTFGAEYQYDSIDSFTENVTAGVPSIGIQGPLGDDGSYGLLSVYLQDQSRIGQFDLTAGVNFTYAHARANEVDNPAVAGSNPATPNNIIKIDESWNALTGSVRGLYHVTPDLNVYGGVSQAFRAPSLYDLTSFDETSAAEFPSPGLDPEKFLQYEVGVKARGESWNVHASWWYTQIFGAIIPSPTGLTTPSGTPIVAKANTGDGFNQGADIDGAWNFWDRFTVYGWFAWQEGAVDQTVFPAAGSPFTTRSHISRAMPLSALLGIKYEADEARWYAEGVVRGAADADKLSLKDKTDTQRIPPGGTPGYLVVDVRGGFKFSEMLRVSAAVENIGDVNYRIHGSGTNEVGINFVLGVDIRF